MDALPREVKEPLLAAIELVERSGARDFEVGHLEEGATPCALGRWWAKAQYHGQRLYADEHVSPAHAADALARQILEGGQCTLCGLTVATAQQLVEKAAEGLVPKTECCLWIRRGEHWIAGCVDPDAEARRLESAVRSGPGQMVNREQRRRAGRQSRRRASSPIVTEVVEDPAGGADRGGAPEDDAGEEGARDREVGPGHVRTTSRS